MVDSTSSALGLLSSLPIPHPTLLSLLTSQTPLAYPSSSSQGIKFLARLNTSVLTREPACASIASIVVQQDEEGYALSTFGKGWIGACIGVLGGEGDIAFLELIATIVQSSSRFPSFERENVLPVTGKLAVILNRVIERQTAQGRWDVLMTALKATQIILRQYPSAFRPSQQQVQFQLLTILIHTTIGSSSTPPTRAPHAVSVAAAELLSVLHMIGGKATAPTTWGNEIRGIVGGIGAAISAITADAWDEEPFGTPPPPLITLPLPPSEPVARSELGLVWLEGWTEAALAYLGRVTQRPVPLPIAHLVSASLRCLSLTLATPTTSFISPQHHALLVAFLPRIWTCGTLLLASTAAACGDHLLPHLSTILEQTVFLLQQCPASMPESRSQLLNLHVILLELYSPALLHIDYPTALLKYSLSVISGVFQHRPSVSIPDKGGKKRARGLEDKLVAGLEGRTGKRLSEVECDVVLQALEMTKLLHSTPLLSPSLLTLSIRIHLALHLSLPSAPISADLNMLAVLQNAVEDVLSSAALMNEVHGGTSRGWQTLLLSVMPTRGERFSLLLHPSVPPMHRPQPPLSQLHFFSSENEEERRLRLELGFTHTSDDLARKKGKLDEEMEMDEPVSTPARDLHLTVDGPQPVPNMTLPRKVERSVPQIEPPPAQAAPILLDDQSGKVEMTLVPPEPVHLPQNSFMDPPTSERTKSTQPVLDGFTSTDKGKAMEIEVEVDVDGSEDESIPDLDSGSSDGENEDDED